MRVNIDATTVLIVAAAGYLYWQWQANRLGQGVSPEMQSYVGQQVRPPIWDGWFSNGEQASEQTGESVGDTLQREFESGNWGASL